MLRCLSEWFNDTHYLIYVVPPNAIWTCLGCCALLWSADETKPSVISLSTFPSLKTFCKIVQFDIMIHAFGCYVFLVFLMKVNLQECQLLRLELTSSRQILDIFSNFECNQCIFGRKFLLMQIYWENESLLSSCNVLSNSKSISRAYLISILTFIQQSLFV